MSKRNVHRGPEYRESTQEFELGIHEVQNDSYLLRLYVSGMTPNSQRAIKNIRKICVEHLAGRYQLDIIDIYQNPVFDLQGQIVAAPTLVKERPPPLWKFVGDMSQTERILMGLDVRTR